MGLFVRTWHEGRWQAVELVTLTDDEVHLAIAGLERAELEQWVVALVGWVRDHPPADPP